MHSNTMATIKGWFAGALCAMTMLIPQTQAMGVTSNGVPPVPSAETISVVEVVETPIPTATPAPTPAPTPTPIPEPVPEVVLNDEEFRMLCIVAMAEAGNQDPMGIRLVIDTILNRVDHWRFPNDVLSVLYQQNQFSCVWDGGIQKCYVRDDIAQLVKEECMSRTNRDVGFFRTMHFGAYGTPLFQHGAHYFNACD